MYPILCLASLPISTKETENSDEDLSCDIEGKQNINIHKKKVFQLALQAIICVFWNLEIQIVNVVCIDTQRGNKNRFIFIKYEKLFTDLYIIFLFEIEIMDCYCLINSG